MIYGLMYVENCVEILNDIIMLTNLHKNTRVLSPFNATYLCLYVIYTYICTCIFSFIFVVFLKLVFS